MIKPFLQDDAFLASVTEGRACGDEAVRIWWLGQSGFLVQWRGEHLLLDPYLSDSLTKKYSRTDKPHVRMTELVIVPERLDFIDVITSSHNHTDHLDPETLIPLLHANPRASLVVPAANLAFVAERLGVAQSVPRGLRIGESMSIGSCTITAVPAAHEELRDEFGGYVIEVGSVTIYHSGDTVLFSGMVEHLREFHVDVALLPINGRAPERRVAGNLDGPEAARLARGIGAKVVIPCHYEMFEFNTASPALFVAECERIGQPFRVLKAGEMWSSNEP